MAEFTVVLASLGSLAGVGHLLQAGSGQKHDIAAAVVGILSVAASLARGALPRSLCALRPAVLSGPPEAAPGRLPPDGIAPTYADFAYLAFTVG